MSKTVTIQASSKVSVKIADNFYTVEYSESRSLDERDDLISEREQLWSDVNGEVDNQIADIFDTFSKKK